MRGAAEHYSVSASEIKYRARLFRTIDISVRKHGNSNEGFDLTNRLVLRIACIKILTRATVHGKRLNTGAFSDARDLRAVAAPGAPAGADLERYGHAHGADHGLEQLSHERLIFEQRRATGLTAHFLRGTSHVYVDDLRAQRLVDACGLSRAQQVPILRAARRAARARLRDPARRRDFAELQRRVSAVSISEAARPAPSCRQRIRNGRSVTPAIGASTAFDASS